MTDEQWETLNGNFDTTQILDAVKVIDETRQHLSDRKHCQPPQIHVAFLASQN